MQFEIILISSFKIFSIKTGATFSPPAVINNSFILPVIAKLFSLSILPISPNKYFN